MHIAGDLVATPANYETVTSFLLRFVVQRLKTRKTVRLSLADTANQAILGASFHSEQLLTTFLS